MKKAKGTFVPSTSVSERKRIIKKLDDLVRDRVRKRDKVCKICGNDSSLQVCHIFSRHNKGTRWDLGNLVLLCYYHHMRFAHSNPIEFSEWTKKYLGERKYDLLRYKAKEATKFTTAELEILYKELKYEMDK